MFEEGKSAAEIASSIGIMAVAAVESGNDLGFFVASMDVTQAFDTVTPVTTSETMEGLNIKSVVLNACDAVPQPLRHAGLPSISLISRHSQGFPDRGDRRDRFHHALHAQRCRRASVFLLPHAAYQAARRFSALVRPMI